MGAASRNKGKAGEREVARALREILGDVVRRCWERAQERGPDAARHDLDVPGWAGEVKRYARIGLHRWWEQAEEQAARSNALPALFHREDGNRQWLVTIRLEDWARLARESIVEASQERLGVIPSPDGQQAAVGGSGASVAPSGDGDA